MKKIIFSFIMIVVLLMSSASTVVAAPDKYIGVNVVLNTDITDGILNELGKHGKVQNLLVEIDALTMRVRESKLDALRALPFVDAANPDAVRNGVPIYTVEATDFSEGISTWNLDAVNVTDFEPNERTVGFDGDGVYVAVLDTGLVDTWRNYFPEQRIATEYAKSFGGGGGEVGNVSEQPNKWEHDVNSHGTHVTSTILGYNMRGTPVNGVAPMVTVIPVKVLNQNGSGWSSVVAQGITYVADLKAGPLSGHPVVINMSLGGPVLDAVEEAAIEYAISVGVIIVASAGNNGTAGMGYPGAHPPVISVAASGWAGEWTTGTWWYSIDVEEPTNPAHFYITDFSSRALPGQDLDVAAPGSWIVGPYKLNSGNNLSYYFLGGTSMASPHVAGIVALMAQKNNTLTAGQAESILETNTISMAPDWGLDETGHGLVDAEAALAATP